jgi:hypothetical protein
VLSLLKDPGPHSQCSNRENPKFLPNFRHKNNTFKVYFQLIFVFNICLCNYGLALKGKNCWITTQICVYFIREKFENLRQDASELCEWGIRVGFHIAIYSLHLKFALWAHPFCTNLLSLVENIFRIFSMHWVLCSPFSCFETWLFWDMIVSLKLWI